MSENDAKTTDQDLISEDGVEEVDNWDPEVRRTAPSTDLDLHKLRRLLLALEVALRDTRQASQDVKSLLPSMNAVAQNIENAALSPMRLVFAGCGGTLAGALAMWWLLRGGAL
ncbi:MAG: hypothetical protein MPN21_22915 [Thermoanaerobaculia bacterium]|nr:hypothetical protein [Thermoanaerobaculia bacterium]